MQNSCYTSSPRMEGLACDTPSRTLCLMKSNTIAVTAGSHKQKIHFLESLEQAEQISFLYSVEKLNTNISSPNLPVVIGDQYRMGVLYVSPLHRR